MPDERRRHERVRIRAEAVVVEDGTEVRLLARDLSVGGALLVCAPDRVLVLEPGQRISLTLLTDEDGPHHAVEVGTTVHTAARVVWRNGAALGVAFEDVDLDTHARLLALVDLCGD